MVVVVVVAAGVAVAVAVVVVVAAGVVVVVWSTADTRSYPSQLHIQPCSFSCPNTLDYEREREFT